MHIITILSSHALSEKYKIFSERLFFERNFTYKKALAFEGANFFYFVLCHQRIKSKLTIRVPMLCQKNNVDFVEKRF
jgi:hypothetical protein